jgi:hypothetical protein
MGSVLAFEAYPYIFNPKRPEAKVHCLYHTLRVWRTHGKFFRLRVNPEVRETGQNVTSSVILWIVWSSSVAACLRFALRSAS